MLRWGVTGVKGLGVRKVFLEKAKPELNPQGCTGVHWAMGSGEKRVRVRRVGREAERGVERSEAGPGSVTRSHTATKTRRSVHFTGRAVGSHGGLLTQGVTGSICGLG